VTEEDGFVPYGQRVGYLLNNVPEAHMRRLYKRAEKQKTSMTNVVGEILAARYGIGFVASTRPQLLAFQTRGNLSLRLPLAVLEAARTEADARAVTIRTVLLDALSEALRLRPPAPTSVDPAKRPGRPRTERTP
jgi:hypothetical protein